MPSLNNNMDTGKLVDNALVKFPKAKRIAVENFCFSASDDKTTNQWNLTEDARMYAWNAHTTGAIRTVLRTENKL